MKTARFSEVVNHCGAPEAYTLWSDPKKDAQFQRALKQHRIMMVHQENVGTKADFGLVGFDGKVAGELLVFPKSLKSFEGRKVIGVKYELLEGSGRSSTAKGNVRARKGRSERRMPSKKKKPVGGDRPDREAKIVPFTPEGEEHSKRETPLHGSKPRGLSKPPNSETRRDRNTSPLPEKPVRPGSRAEAQKANVAISVIRKKLRQAMKALQAGKAVQCYQMLEQLDREIS